MSELVRLSVEQPQEQPLEPPVDAAGHSMYTSPTETGLMLVEQEKPLEKADVDALQQKAGELRSIANVQSGLEGCIIGAGLQVMADRYGADQLLDAMHSEGTIQGIIGRLAPKKEERAVLYDAISTEPMDSLAQRFNDTLGGVADGNPGVTRMERFRNFEVVQIQGKMTSGNGMIPRYRNKEGHTDSAHQLLSGDLNNLLEKHPELVEGFRETNDTLGLLKGMRDIYETEYAQFTTDLDRAKATIEEKVGEGETSVTELQTLSDAIYTSEIANLEERLVGASSDATRDMVQGMLDKKAAEVIAAREEFKASMEAVRNKVVSDLGADRLYQLPVATPIEPRPTYDDREWRAA